MLPLHSQILNLINKQVRGKKKLWKAILKVTFRLSVFSDFLIQEMSPC